MSKIDASHINEEYIRNAYNIEEERKDLYLIEELRELELNELPDKSMSIDEFLSLLHANIVEIAKKHDITNLENITIETDFGYDYGTILNVIHREPYKESEKDAIKRLIKRDQSRARSADKKKKTLDTRLAKFAKQKAELVKEFGTSTKLEDAIAAQMK